MRVIVLFLICISVINCTTFNEKVNEMMVANAQASDAVDTVAELLQELKGSIYDEQADHDERWAQQQRDGRDEIAELTQIANNNRASAEDATAHREWVEGEIEDSHNHLDWIAGRLADIDAQLAKLLVSRCEANQLFVMQLKEHQDALDAIAFLRTEIDRTQAAGGELPVFAQEEETYSSKLAQFEHMFEAQAINEFFQNTDVQNADDIAYVDDTHAGREESGQHDNTVGALDTESFESTVDTSDLTGSIWDRVHAMLTRLQTELEAGAQLLEDNEIQAALDSAEFQIKSAAEQVSLHNDAEKRHAYLEKLAVDLQVALDDEAAAWELSRLSDEAVVDAKDRLAALHDNYVQQTDRRNGELADLDWVIDLFMEEVASLGQALRDRIEDYVHDERFDSMFHREGDSNVEGGVWGL